MPFVFLHEVFDLALTQQKNNFGAARLCVNQMDIAVQKAFTIH